MSLATTAFGLATVLLAVGFSVPQLVRLLRTGETAGVSLAGTANSAISFTAWTWYAWSAADLWLFLSSIVGIPGGVLTVVLTWRRGIARDGLWLPVLWSGVLLAAVTLDAVVGSSALALAVGGSVLWLLGPALASAYRSADVSGIAAGTWLVLGLEGVLFLGYGLLAAVPASVIYGVVTVLGSTAMLARLVLAHRPSPRGPVPPAAPGPQHPVLVSVARTSYSEGMS